MTSPQQAFVLPVGTVTFLLTDVAGSTRMWESEDDDAMRTAIVRHYEILSEIVNAHGGVRPQEQGEGDSIVAAFARPSDALAAAAVAQAALGAEEWPTGAPIRVRMAIHTGEAHLRDDTNYAGQAIIRTARLRAVGHGGQVLVSGATRDLAVDQLGDRFDLRFLGEHRLRDLGRPEHVWQLVVPGGVDEFEPLATLDAVPNSLPVSLSPFIGREAEVAELAALVAAERLVTATGTGGAGKTRLAQQVGAELIEGFPVGVWWVELAPVAAEGVASAVRAGFGVAETTTIPLAESVRRMLGDRACLLVVDNCEHVTEAVAPLIHELLTSAPTLHVLATSRVMLDLPGEQAWRVPSLALPEPGVVVPVEVLGQFDSVRLFSDRARRARPNFELTTANGPVVAEICHRLGGIPLAIELAAARCRMLDPRRILDGLDDSFRILSGGSKAVMPRQQTLDASIAWSYDLLTPAEQALLRRVSVFVDGWTLEAAEAICPDPGAIAGGADGGLDAYAVFDALDRLLDHSLVYTIDTEVGVRFEMLETIRQYAARRLAEDDTERTETHERHSRHLMEWACSLGGALRAEEGEAPFNAVVDERSNLLAAAQRGVDVGDIRLVLRGLDALAPAMDATSWAPAAPQMLVLLDRIDSLVDAEDEWRVHHIRFRTILVRGDVTSELETLARMEASARAADQPVGIGIARFQSLSTLSYAGIDTFDEMTAAIDELERHDPWWAATGRLYLRLAAAYWGRLSLADAASAKVLGQPTNPSYAAVSDLALAMTQIARGEASEALLALDRAITSPWLAGSATPMALGFYAGACAYLGIDNTGEILPRLSHGFRVDGRQTSGAVEDLTRCIHHLLADELDEALACSRRAIDQAVSLGLSSFDLYSERHVLIAAGVDVDFEDVISRGAGPNASTRTVLAEVLFQGGDIAGALSMAHEAFAMALPERSLMSTLITLECVSRFLTAAERHEEATRVRGACTSFRSDHSLVPYPCLQRLLDDAADSSRQAMGDDAYETALAEGATLSIQAAAEFATRLRVSNTGATVGWDALTPTEARVAELVAEGLTNPQVGKELLMGAETVKTHLSRVFDKVGVANRKELIVAASRRAAERHR